MMPCIAHGNQRIATSALRMETRTHAASSQYSFFRDGSSSLTPLLVPLCPALCARIKREAAPLSLRWHAQQHDAS